MASNKFDREVVDLVNQERSDAGLEPLVFNLQLDNAANYHTDQMVDADEMSHQVPGEAPLGDRVSDANYEWRRVGENVAAGYVTPESVVDGWMNSPGHRENILNPDFTEIGIGYANAPDNKSNYSDYDTYWTQVFGTPINSSTPSFNFNSIPEVDNSQSEPETFNSSKVDFEKKEIDAGSNYEQKVVDLVNEARAEEGLDSLVVNSQLDQAADLHTDEMVQAGYMSHRLPGEARLGDRVSETGYDWRRVGENVAAGYITPEDVVDAWLESPGHRANILNPQFTEIGIGYEDVSDSNFGKYDTYWTQVFGTDGVS